MTSGDRNKCLASAREKRGELAVKTGIFSAGAGLAGLRKVGPGEGNMMQLGF
jgi:hypothetical protein